MNYAMNTVYRGELKKKTFDLGKGFILGYWNATEFEFTVPLSEKLTRAQMNQFTINLLHMVQALNPTKTRLPMIISICKKKIAAFNC